mgnify:CR=1 FL=1
MIFTILTVFDLLYDAFVLLKAGRKKTDIPIFRLIDGSGIEPGGTESAKKQRKQLEDYIAYNGDEEEDIYAKV